MTGLAKLLHRLGFHSVDRCPSEHSWEWCEGKWVAGVPVPPTPRKPQLRSVGTDEPELPGDPSWPGSPTGEMEPPRKLPPVTPPTTLIRAQRPPGQHRPKGDRIVPPRRPEA